MSGIIFTAIFGILATIVGSVWLLAVLIQQFEKNLQGLFLFGLLAFCVLFIAKGLLKSFLESAKN